MLSNRPWAVLFPSVLLSGFLLCGAASATLVVALPLDRLIDQAEEVMVARVEAMQSRWTADHSAIVTEVTVQVVDSMKGGNQRGERVIVRREGGEVGGVGMLVSGAAHFVAGEEVVLFLERRQGTSATLWTVGMAQGKMHVATSAGRKMAVRDTSGLSALPGSAGAPSAEPRARPLEELVRYVRARARRAP